MSAFASQEPLEEATLRHWPHAVSEKSGSNSVVECNLAKVEVAGSNPVSRSTQNAWLHAGRCCLNYVVQSEEAGLGDSGP